jgi:hypothetical protein
VPLDSRYTTRMYTAKPNTHLTVEPGAGDVVHLPRRLFERLFADFEGGVLGIVLKADEEQMYATAAPSAEQGDDIYMPLWMATAFEQRLGRHLEGLLFDVIRAEPIAKASLIVARQCVEVEMDVREALESFFFDCRYVHANTVLQVDGCEIWIERLIDAEGFEIAVAELGLEVSVDIQGPLDDGGAAEEARRAAEADRRAAEEAAEAARRAAEEAAEEARRAAEATAKPQGIDAATLRAKRLAFYEKKP